MGNISVILNVYKRSYTLKDQINAILAQSVEVKPEDIHIWYNTPEDGQHGQYFPDIPGIKTYWCNYNTKFFGRFLIPLLCKTEFIAMFDDDIIPQPNWLQNCLDSMEKKEGIYGGIGVITNGKTYEPRTVVGWNGIHSDEITQVDLVGHSWFYRQEWARFLWDEPPVSWDNGEDMMFAYVCQKQGIDSFVPPHPESDKSIWACDRGVGNQLGNDMASSWRIRNYITDRDKIVMELIKRGWKTLK